MAEEISEVIYLGRDNAIVLQLTEEGSPAALADVSRIVVDLGAVEVDSAQTPDLITWAGSLVTLKLGTAAGIATIGKSAVARLIVYSPDNPHGLVWIERFRVRIVNELV